MHDVAIEAQRDALERFFASGQSPTAGERLAILRRAKTIAVVGASANPARASNFVLTYLLSSRTHYVVWPVPPKEDGCSSRAASATSPDRSSRSW